MNEILELISPLTIGEDRIVITVDPASQPLQPQKAITLQFDFTDTLPEGLVLPLDLEVQPAFGEGIGYQRVRFDRYLPQSYAITVALAGQYLILLKETGHNFWQGRILLDVQGDAYNITRTNS